MRAIVSSAIAMLALAGCDPEPPMEQSPPPPADPIGEHGAPGPRPADPADEPVLLFEDDHDQAIVRPEPEPVSTLQEAADRGREALVAEGVLESSKSRDAEIIAGIRARWFFNGQGVTVQNEGSELVHVSVDFMGDDCHASVAYRDVEAGGSLAIEPIRPGCEAEFAQMTVLNELGYPIHVVEISAADRREAASR